MELVYLWVEDYKNIKKQGFNFSPRFECNYDESTNKLTIDEKVNYVDIFPENINVTAIVGENGSGKSSLLEKFHYFFGKKLSIVSANNQLKVYTPIDDITILNKTTKPHSIIRDERISQVHFSWDILHYEPVIDWSSFYKTNPNILLSLLGTFSHPEYMDLSSYQNNSVIKYIEVFLKNKTNIFDFNPNEINIKFPMKKDLDEWDFEKIKKEIEKLKFPEKEAETKKEIYFKTISEYIKKYLHDGNFEKKFTLEKYNLLLNELEHMKEVLTRFPSFILDMYENDVSFFGLSHGERSILLSNALLYEAIVDSKYQDILICLDEPDLSLHPEWQKKYINELIKMFSKVTKKIHFLITSHSPLILSDIPKENVVFLKAGEQVDVDINPFGANIHTLLSHGFFMKDGLIGGFAKEKIQNVINFLHRKESTIQSKEDAWKIIQIIGEPFLKYKLEEKFHEKYSSDEVKNEAKIKRLEQEIERLKNVKTKD